MSSNFSFKVFEAVQKIPKGKFLSYKEVARRAGKIKDYRAVANLMARNQNHLIPCHRVIKNNNEVGGYKGSFKNRWLKVALLLKEGAIGVIPTDTIYGICSSVLKKQNIEKIYQLRKMKKRRPMIILIFSLADLKKFEIKLTKWQKKILSQIWPGKISVVLKYGRKTLALRMPKDKELTKILKISGPLVAPSANFEGCRPAKTIFEARKYFKNKIFYYNKGEIIGQPSTLIDLTQRPIKILRQGSDFKKIKIKWLTIVRKTERTKLF